MGIATKIDWCDSTWNPVTGCLNGCRYCYARRIAERFGDNKAVVQWKPKVLTERVKIDGKIHPYPFGFCPTLHRYKMDDPQTWKKPKNIFVCSMADLFGRWVPDEWIQTVFEACIKAPQHRYIFLTKFPGRYTELSEKIGWFDRYFTRENFWFGRTVEKPDINMSFGNPNVNCFISVEPILQEPYAALQGVPINSGWVIVGAETGNRKRKVKPKREWINMITRKCDEYGVPVFMKESLRELMGDGFRQEFPWENKR